MGLTSLVTGCVERLLSGCPLSVGSLVLTYINKFCNSLEFHNMSPMSKGAFYGRTGVGQPGPSRVKIQDWLANGFLLLCSPLRESLSTAIMADLAWTWSESQKSHILPCTDLSLRQLGSCFIWTTPLSCAHQPLNGKAMERASFPVY